jgi:hypothetical protein
MRTALVQNAPGSFKTALLLLPKSSLERTSERVINLIGQLEKVDDVREIINLLI